MNLSLNWCVLCFSEAETQNRKAMGMNLGSVLMNLGGLASTDSEEVSVSSITLFVTLLCICVVLGHLLEENRWINESVNALLIVSYSQWMSFYVSFCFSDLAGVIVLSLMTELMV